MKFLKWEWEWWNLGRFRIDCKRKKEPLLMGPQGCCCRWGPGAHQTCLRPPHCVGVAGKALGLGYIIRIHCLKNPYSPLDLSFFFNKVSPLKWKIWYIHNHVKSIVISWHKCNFYGLLSDNSLCKLPGTVYILHFFMFPFSHWTKFW